MNDDFMLELQKLASENEDVLVTVDGDGEIEFEIDMELFVKVLKDVLQPDDDIV